MIDLKPERVFLYTALYRFWNINVQSFQNIFLISAFPKIPEFLPEKIIKRIYQRIANGIDMAQFVFLDARTKKKREISQAAMDLIKSLCKRSPTSRLGQGSTADFIQRTGPNFKFKSSTVESITVVRESLRKDIKRAVFKIFEITNGSLGLIGMGYSVDKYKDHYTEARFMTSN